MMDQPWSGYRPQISIRQATSEDVAFVAECVMAAWGSYDFKKPSEDLKSAETICSREDSLYSYKNAMIAFIEGTPIGCVIAYDGAFRDTSRVATQSAMENLGVNLPNADPEIGTGEYHIGTVALRPNFRGYDIGKLLIQTVMETGKKKGFSRISLIARKDKEELCRYCGKLGFKEESEVTAAGKPYVKMVMGI